MKTNKVFKMPRNIINSGIKVTDIAVLADIMRYRNEKNVTEFRYGFSIAQSLDITDRSIKTCISNLKKVGAFEVSKVNVDGTTKFRNVYTFKNLDKDFIIISNDIFDMSLTNKEIGFLIKLKANVYNNGLSLKGNKESLAKLVGIATKSFNKYLTKLEGLGLISYSDSVLTLSEKLFTNTHKAVVTPTERTKELINTAITIAKSHANYQNVHHGENITSLNREVLNMLLNNGLDKSSYLVVLATLDYKVGKVNDINAYVNSIYFPKTATKNEILSITL